MNVEFDVASNPEFLKEGAAIKDFMEPDRVVVGVDSGRARTIMERLYKPFIENGRLLLFTDIPSAEMIKYASNAMLATRISFMNDIANLCERLGADVDMVRQGMGADPRIGPKFLYPGIGYGGSCFPKDVKALVNTARSNGYDMKVLRAVEEVNGAQKRLLFEKFRAYFRGDIAGRRVAVWGLSFKPETDDMREAPSVVIIEHLLRAGCEVCAYDPVASEEARRILGDGVCYCRDKYEAAEGADALMLVTEWQEFRMPDWCAVRKAMRTPVVFDGRNIYNGEEACCQGICILFHRTQMTGGGLRALVRRAACECCPPFFVGNGFEGRRDDPDSAYYKLPPRKPSTKIEATAKSMPTVFRPSSFSPKAAMPTSVVSRTTLML